MPPPSLLPPTLVSASLKRTKLLQELKNTYHYFNFVIFFRSVLTVAQKPNFSQFAFLLLAFQRFLSDVSLPDEIRWDSTASTVTFSVCLLRTSQCISQEDKASAGAQEYISLLQLRHLLQECSNSGTKAKYPFNGSCLMLVSRMKFAGIAQHPRVSASLKRTKLLQELKNTYHYFNFVIFFRSVLTVAQKPNFSQFAFLLLAFQRFLSDVSLPDEIRWDSTASTVTFSVCLLRTIVNCEAACAIGSCPPLPPPSHFSQCISQEDKASAGAQEYISLLQLRHLLQECSNSGTKAKYIFRSLHFYY
ncbi:uncharacterized protein LOC126875922 [Bombus huntii]|uniref:uncharacterized protein LOC126875922 n=1 Tax=Bombus huntii TaxID=85661 RepID=UPI0021A9CE02|nr:uncharacterized protein LOC126875922 [Bombus huntii]